MIRPRSERSFARSTAIAAAIAVMGFATAGRSEALPVRKSHATMVLDAIDGFIVPRLGALSKATKALSTDVQAVCAASATEATRKAAAASFADVVRAWAAIDFVRFGPVSQEHRLERVFFWPDPRATTFRQLNGVLAAKKDDVVTSSGLAKQSVAVQGLTALEILLFDEKAPLGAGTDETARYRCAFAKAIAANLDTIAGDIEQGWKAGGGFRTKMLTPGSDNVLYKDASETARDVVKALATGLDVASNRFVIPDLQGTTATPPKHARLPFEKSELTGDSLRAALVSLKSLFDATGIAAFVPADKPWMAKFLPNAWESLAADAQTLDKLREKESGSEAHLHALRKMKFDLSGIRQIIVKELAPSADITLGFNDLDGD